jgi:DnaK suppressor protein
VADVVTTRLNADAKATRDIDLERMLKERRVELLNEVQFRKRDARTEHAKDFAVLDEGENSEADIQDEIAFALIQMKTEMLNMIATALHRLKEGTYGSCSECSNDIPEPRLRALPFAVRCKRCEEALESARRWERIVAQRQSSAALLHMSR